MSQIGSQPPNANPPLRVAVTGDTGLNIYTQYVKGFESSDRRVLKPEAAYDVYVPAGAAFTAKAMQHLLGKNPALTIEHLLPQPAIPKERTYSTMHKFLVELDFFGREHPKLRVKRSRPIDDRNITAKERDFHFLTKFDGTKPNPDAIDLLVVHDGAGSWRRFPSKSHEPQSDDAIDAMDFIKKLLEKKDGREGCPRVIVNLNYDLPKTQRTNKPRELSFQDNLTFWHKLLEHRDKVCVICSANMLRREGAAISRRLSWEQSAEDLAADLLLFDKLKILSRFRHLIIRFGIVGALHLMSDGRHRSADLVFAPIAKTGFYRDPIEDGTVESQGIFLSIGVVHAIANASVGSKARKVFVDGIETGLLGCMTAFDSGYTVFWNEGKNRSKKAGDKLIEDLCSNIKGVFEKHQSKKTEISPEHILGHSIVPCQVIDRPPAVTGKSSGWEILRNAINPSVIADEDFVPAYADAANDSRINVGIAIVLFGHAAVLNRHWTNDERDADIRRVLQRPPCVVTVEETRDYVTLPVGQKPALPPGPVCVAPPLVATAQRHDPIFVPTLRFNKLVVVERAEIESIRGIRNLIKDYIEGAGDRLAIPAPISIAVFGPPGSGKSFMVRQIANDINNSLRPEHPGLETIEYNIAQFRSVEELGEAITRASIVNNEGKTPLVYFDEFDSNLSGTPLGWLKYFLSPMQEGTFYGVRQTISTGKAVFVFSGGIHNNFERFDPWSIECAAGDSEELDGLADRQRMFAEAKGPDFISRLRGHINVLPINGTEGDVKPVIRRAIILRGLLEKRGLLAKVRHHEVAMIDEDVIYALLTIDKYRHGTRSMEAVIQMCAPMDRRIEKASLPPRAQLNMHVDAEEFFIRIFRGRFRPPSPEDPAENVVLRDGPESGLGGTPLNKPEREQDDMAGGEDAGKPSGDSSVGTHHDDTSEEPEQ